MSSGVASVKADVSALSSFAHSQNYVPNNGAAGSVLTMLAGTYGWAEPAGKVNDVTVNGNTALSNKIASIYSPVLKVDGTSYDLLSNTAFGADIVINTGGGGGGGALDAIGWNGSAKAVTQTISGTTSPVVTFLAGSNVTLTGTNNSLTVAATIPNVFVSSVTVGTTSPLNGSGTVTSSGTITIGHN